MAYNQRPQYQPAANNYGAPPAPPQGNQWQQPQNGAGYDYQHGYQDNQYVANGYGYQAGGQGWGQDQYNQGYEQQQNNGRQQMNGGPHANAAHDQYYDQHYNQNYQQQGNPQDRGHQYPPQQQQPQAHSRPRPEPIDTRPKQQTRQRILQEPVSPDALPWDNPFPLWNSKKKDGPKKQGGLEKDMGKMDINDSRQITPEPKQGKRRSEEQRPHTSHGAGGRPSHGQVPPEQVPPVQYNNQTSSPPARGPPPVVGRPRGLSRSNTLPDMLNGVPGTQAPQQNWPEPPGVSTYHGPPDRPFVGARPSTSGETTVHSRPDLQRPGSEEPRSNQRLPYVPQPSNGQTNWQVQGSGFSHPPAGPEMPNFNAMNGSRTDELSLQTPISPPSAKPAYQKATYKSTTQPLSPSSIQPPMQGILKSMTQPKGGNADPALGQFAFGLPSSPANSRSNGHNPREQINSAQQGGAIHTNPQRSNVPPNQSVTSPGEARRGPNAEAQYPGGNRQDPTMSRSGQVLPPNSSQTSMNGQLSQNRQGYGSEPPVNAPSMESQYSGFNRQDSGMNNTGQRPPPNAPQPQMNGPAPQSRHGMPQDNRPSTRGSGRNAPYGEPPVDSRNGQRPPKGYPQNTDRSPPHSSANRQGPSPDSRQDGPNKALQNGIPSNKVNNVNGRAGPPVQPAFVDPMTGQVPSTDFSQNRNRSPSHGPGRQGQGPDPRQQGFPPNAPQNGSSNPTRRPVNGQAESRGNVPPAAPSKPSKHPKNHSQPPQGYPPNGPPQQPGQQQYPPRTASRTGDRPTKNGPQNGAAPSPVQQPYGQYDQQYQQGYDQQYWDQQGYDQGYNGYDYGYDQNYGNYDNGYGQGYQDQYNAPPTQGMPPVQQPPYNQAQPPMRPNQSSGPPGNRFSDPRNPPAQMSNIPTGPVGPSPSAGMAARPPPVRPGLEPQIAPVPGMDKPAPIRQYDQQGGQGPLPPQVPQVQTTPRQSAEQPKRASIPVTAYDLNLLQQAIRSNPEDHKTALTFAKKLVEAASVLSNEGGRADAKTTQKNREKYIFDAHKQLKRLVNAGYAEAMFYLADCYGTGGLGLQVDPQEAFKLYQSAAKLGHPQAAYRVAVCCEMGHEEGGGTKRDPLRAVQWYKRAATMGDAPAMYKTAMISLKGLLGQPQNKREAHTWLKRAAEKADAENPHALHELGLMYESAGPDDAVIRDLKHARSLFEQAGKLGYKFSQYRLASAFESGNLDCPIDPRQSIMWYSKAAAQGEHQSELALSGWYLTGSDGILQQSDTEAYLWARKAAQSGLAKAEYAMGYFTEVGIGVSPNMDEAKKWYWRAASQNYAKARERLEALKKGGGKMQKTRVSRSNINKQGEGECIVM